MQNERKNNSEKSPYSAYFQIQSPDGIIVIARYRYLGNLVLQIPIKDTVGRDGATEADFEAVKHNNTVIPDINDGNSRNIYSKLDSSRKPFLSSSDLDYGEISYSSSGGAYDYSLQIDFNRVDFVNSDAFTKRLEKNGWKMVPQT